MRNKLSGMPWRSDSWIVFLVFFFSGAGAAYGDELTGRVFSVAGDVIMIKLDAGQQARPGVGDEATVSFALSGGTQIKVGTWRVTAVEGRNVTAEKIGARGQVNVNMQARITTGTPDATVATQNPSTRSTEEKQLIDTAEIADLVAVTRDIGNYAWSDAGTQCRYLEQDGHTDWVLPTIEQLARLHQSAPEPIKQLDLQGCCVWSADTWEETSGGFFGKKTERYGWIFNFQAGLQEKQDLDEVIPATKHPEIRTICTRTPPAENIFFKGPDNTIKDIDRQLLWTRVSDGNVYTWSGAGTYCKSLERNGLPGWRLPTIKELETLMDKSFSKPMNQQCHIRDPFQVDGTHPRECILWSADLNDEENAWFYSFEYGGRGWGHVDNKTLDRMKGEGTAKPWEGPRTFCVRAR